MSLRHVPILLSAVLTVSFAFAQSFEVASIRPSGPRSVRGSGGGPGSNDPTRYHSTAESLDDLIVTAWNVDYFQVSSPTPLDRQNFDLVATISEGATKEQFRLMSQQFLAERFALKVYTESRDFPAYELVVANRARSSKRRFPASQLHRHPRRPFPAILAGQRCSRTCLAWRRRIPRAAATF